MTNELVPLLKAAEFFPRTAADKKKHINCLYRYAVGLENGCKLETRKVGKLLFTTREWVDQFVMDCSKRTDPKPEPRVNENAIVRRLTAKGVFGAKAKNEMLGVRRRGEASRAVSAMSPSRTLCGVNKQDNGRGTDRGETAAAEIHDASKRLPVVAGAAVGAKD